MAAVAVLFDLKGAGPSVLHRVTEPMQRTNARIAAPGEHAFRRTARTDQLVIDDVGRHPDERQAFAAPAGSPHDLPHGGSSE